MQSHPMSQTSSFLAKYPWVILLVIAYAMLWWLSLSDSYVGVLIGPMTDAPAANGDTLGTLRAPLPTICEYARFGATSFALVEMPNDADGCGVLRILSENQGHVLEFGRSAKLWSSIK